MTGGQPPDPRSILPKKKAAGPGSHATTVARLVEREVRLGADTDFVEAVIQPEEVVVTFSGGATRSCWQVTRANGPYTVVFLPEAACFSLCVASMFGPVDIGVHGSAADCYGSV